MGELESQTSTLGQLKAIIRRDLKLSPDTPIPDDMSLSAAPQGGEVEYDSLDILLVLTSVEKAFGVTIIAQPGSQAIFENITRFAEHIDQLRADSGPGKPAPAMASPPAANGKHRPDRVSPRTTSPSVKPAVTSAVGPDPAADAAAGLAGLPHRDPFRFVTRYTTIVPGQSGLGEWKITGSEAFFQGHFPGNPIVPGVLISEAMAQVCGLVQGSGRRKFPTLTDDTKQALDTPEGQPPTDTLMALVHVNVKFRSPVQPPAVVVISASTAAELDQLIRFEVTARVQGQIVAQGQLTLGPLIPNLQRATVSSSASAS
jgi:3-hydroxyacyl-[acyl-carrier-protein] dehydratase